MARMTEMPAPPSFAPGTPGRFWGLVPCAGTGSRAVPAGAAADLPKQYQMVAGHPLVLHTLTAFAGVVRLAGTLVAVASGDHFLDAYPHASYFTAPCGGPTRAATVQGGLLAEPCGDLLREFFARRRAEQKAQRQREREALAGLQAPAAELPAIPAGEALELDAAQLAGLSDLNDLNDLSDLNQPGFKR